MYAARLPARHEIARKLLAAFLMSKIVRLASIR